MICQQTEPQICTLTENNAATICTKFTCFPFSPVFSLLPCLTGGAHFGGTLKIRDLTADRKAANYTGAHRQPEKTLRGAK